jgi:hypothetical protein
MASAPEASRAWLLIGHPGPWPAEAVDAGLPARLRELVASADELGVRVQLIRGPASGVGGGPLLDGVRGLDGRG